MPDLSQEPWVPFTEAFPQGFTGKRSFDVVSAWLSLTPPQRQDVMARLFLLKRWPGFDAGLVPMYLN